MSRRKSASCLALLGEVRSKNVYVRVRKRVRNQFERVAGGSYILIHAADSGVLRQGYSELWLGTCPSDAARQSYLVAVGIQADYVDAANVAAAADDEPDQGAL